MIDRFVQVLDGTNKSSEPRRVSTLRDLHFLVLLGKPGVGKSTVLEIEAAHAGQKAIKARDLINRPTPPDHDTLYLDALDEYRVGASKDWQKSADIEAIRSTTSDQEITVAQILPLTTAEAMEVLSALGEAKPHAFVAKAEAMGASGLLESPLSIRLLRDAVAGGGAWPRTRFALFNQATRHLAHEANAVHRLDPRRPSADEIVTAAARTCLCLMVSGSRNIWRSGALPPVEAPGDYVRVDALGLGRQMINDMLDSPLFRGEGEAFEPVHRTVAEFLARQSLAVAVVGFNMAAAGA